MRQKDIRPAPARIEFKGMKFLITDRPSDATIQSYLMVSWAKDRQSNFKIVKPATLNQPKNFCLCFELLLDVWIGNLIAHTKNRLWAAGKVDDLVHWNIFDLILLYLLKELQKHNVSTVVRVCEPSYKKDVLEGSGIEVRDLYYEDGTFPPTNIVDEWFEVLKQKWVLKKQYRIQILNLILSVDTTRTLMAVSLFIAWLDWVEHLFSLHWH